MCRTRTHLGPWPGSSGPQGPRGARLRGSATRTNVLNDNNDVTQPTGLTYMYNVCLSFAHRTFSSIAASGGEHRISFFPPLSQLPFSFTFSTAFQAAVSRTQRVKCSRAHACPLIASFESMVPVIAQGHFKLLPRYWFLIKLPFGFVRYFAVSTVHTNRETERKCFWNCDLKIIHLWFEDEGKVIILPFSEFFLFSFVELYNVTSLFDDRENDSEGIIRNNRKLFYSKTILRQYFVKFI